VQDLAWGSVEIERLFLHGKDRYRPLIDSVNETLAEHRRLGTSPPDLGELVMNACFFEKCRDGSTFVDDLAARLAAYLFQNFRGFQNFEVLVQNCRATAMEAVWRVLVLNPTYDPRSQDGACLSGFVYAYLLKTCTRQHRAERRSPFAIEITDALELAEKGLHEMNDPEKDLIEKTAAEYELLPPWMKTAREQTLAIAFTEGRLIDEAALRVGGLGVLNEAEEEAFRDLVPLLRRIAERHPELVWDLTGFFPSKTIDPDTPEGLILASVLRTPHLKRVADSRGRKNPTEFRRRVSFLFGRVVIADKQLGKLARHALKLRAELVRPLREFISNPPDEAVRLPEACRTRVLHRLGDAQLLFAYVLPSALTAVARPAAKHSNPRST
jgi:hypothetical protein